MATENDERRDALRQYSIGAFNRRVAAHTENFARYGLAAENDTTDFFCTCGREGCEETMKLSVEEYDRIKEKPHRFLVAPGHATELDDLLIRGDDYWIVEVKPEYRLPSRESRN